tara:strand:+ start:221 stop:415 length:195 start_codon:yes stop_codon:yes gene_type:complete
MSPLRGNPWYNLGMNKTITLTENQHAIMCEIFQFVSSLDLYADDTMEHPEYRFDELWDIVVNAK